MNVQTLMSAPVITVEDKESMLQATRLMKEHRISHLPVVTADGSLIGVITDRDLKRASASDATTLEIHELLYLLDQVKVRDIMTPKPLSVTPAAFASEAADLMLRNKVGCLPVLDGHGLVGIVTKDDLLRQMAKG
ncbi:MAG: CBS domain-containing protein [Deltaproteobacteria bacterium]|nr:CBS domain-containing protein [Deltaproteobacteria bacterium]